MLTVNIKDLSFSWNTTGAPLLSIEQLTIKTGEKLFLQGASGSGKSTLLSILSGILLPQSGQIELLGTSISQINGKARDRFRADHIGYIFQMFNLLPYLNVVENVTLPCHFSKHRFQKVGKTQKDIDREAIRLLDKLGLSHKDLLSKPVTELSLGQQQRVAACRALIGSPELLIADEPTSALDADAQENFLELLSEECSKNNITLVFVSHDERLASQFDSVVRLHKGKLTFDTQTEKTS
jgi:putative ABC transport system ATP-binding protein